MNTLTAHAINRATLPRRSTTMSGAAISGTTTSSTSR